MNENPSGRWADIVRLGVLLLFAAPVRFWLLAPPEVAARASIDSTRVAGRLDAQPWPEVLRTSHQAPGYPLLILAVSKLVRPGAPSADAMVLSAQLVSILASLLTIVPLYFTGRRLFGRNAGFL